MGLCYPVARKILANLGNVTDLESPIPFYLSPSCRIHSFFTDNGPEGIKYLIVGV